MATIPLEPCPGCGALYPPHHGVTHRYIGASSACWAVYEALLAGAAPDPALLNGSRAPDTLLPATPAPLMPRGLDALLVDAYAAQHHGDDGPQAVQSVAVHLLVLHGVLHRGAAVDAALWIRRRALRTRGVFRPLAPPPIGAALTVRHLLPGGEPGAPRTASDYVASVHAAWSAAHEDTLAGWYDAFVLAE